MREHGHDFEQPVPDVHNWSEAQTVDMPRRTKYGYGLVAGAPMADEDASQAIARLPQQEQERYVDDLFGESGPHTLIDLPDGRRIETPRLGCLAQARSTVFGSVQQWATATYVPESLMSVLQPRLPQTWAYRQALQSWARCITEAGLEARSPADLIEQARKIYGQSPPSKPDPRELALATADGGCALRTHLPTATLDAQRHLLESLDPSQKQLLVAAATAWTQAGERAQRVASIAP